MTAHGTMIERHKTWVLAIDGARARLLAFTDRDPALVQVEDWLSHDAHRQASEAEAHRLAAGHPHAAHARHAKEPKADPHFRRKQDFIDALAERINQAGAENAFDSLIVVAPAQALATLRRDFSQAVQERIRTELVRDLAKIPDHALAEHLARDLPVHVRPQRLQRNA